MNFIDYVLSFYSKNGGIYAEFDWSDELIIAMCHVRMAMPRFEGDTIDREWVRDELIKLDEQLSSNFIFIEQE